MVEDAIIRAEVMEENKMNKAELVEKVASAAKLSKKQAGELLDVVFEAVAEGLVGSGEVKVSGFGAFVVRHRAQKQGRNPKTKKPIIIPESKKVAFRPAQALKERVDK